MVRIYERCSKSYDYDFRIRAARDTQQILVQFEETIEYLVKREAALHDALEQGDRLALMSLAALLGTSFEIAKQRGAAILFQDIVRDYVMTPRDRKVIERAALTFSKARVNRIKPDKAVATYEKTLSEYRLFAETAHAVFRENVKHTDSDTGTRRQAGPFALVNTGGFSDQAMAEVTKVVESATRLLHKKGLQRVCYGDIQITNTVYKSTRVLAFYKDVDDSMFIRANLKGKLGPALWSVIHELGHRLQFRFLKSKRREIDSIYRTLKGKVSDARREVIMDQARWPKPGDTYVHKGETFVFDKVDLTNRSNLVAIFRLPDMPRMAIRMPLETYVMQKDPGAQAKASVFVTDYASTSPEENFAEMIACYCEDQLPDDQVQMLEAIL